MEFSPIDTVEYTTGNTPETVKDESQAKRTSFTERLAMIVGMKSRDIVTDQLNCGSADHHVADCTTNK